MSRLPRQCGPLQWRAGAGAAPLRGSMVPKMIQRICQEASQHISTVTFGKCKVVRMAVNLKVRLASSMHTVILTSTALQHAYSDTH